MSRASVLGQVALATYSLLEFRHLIGAVSHQFVGCNTLQCVVWRASRLDDVTVLGIAGCAALAAALVGSLIYKVFVSVVKLCRAMKRAWVRRQATISARAKMEV